MATWAYTHPLPMDSNGRPYQLFDIFPIAVDKCIWTLSTYEENNTDRNALWVFDTETLTHTKIDITLPDDHRNLQSMVKDGDKLYIFSMWDPNGNPNNTVTISPFDTNSMVLTNIFDCPCSHIYGRPQVRGNLVYLLEKDRENVKLIRIDLSSKQVVRYVLNKKSPLFEQELLLNYGQLFLLRHFETGRVLSRIEESNKVVEVNRHYFKEDEYGLFQKRRLRSPTCFDGHLFVFLKKDGKKESLLDAFDFEKNEWERVEVYGLSGFINEYAHLPSARIGDTVYTHVHADIDDERRWSIIQLDLKPSLTDLCLLDLADDLVNETDQVEIDKAVNSVPMGLRAKFKNMIKTGWWAQTEDPNEFFDD